ncbi:FHA domain-containing protein [Luteimonas deserti]|uniref:FHA domain-containing protein n=1 Tax=Luteimonas deserti TaxID=2752306 RepID=A0A7Z0QSW0_9GAMM|nr:FHA domain-containing protein [Luteimonas deserti]NYZ63316.1 FHA domain-containing protein [Luteimonas deserti]
MIVPKLRFPTPDTPDLPLEIGVHGIAPHPEGGGLAPVADGDEPSVRFCVDHRGVWLTVSEGIRGVHVNGRSVRRMALLRTGDAVYVDGHELRLVAGERIAARVAGQSSRDAFDASEPDIRTVLRGVGGRYHGRCFTLERPRLVGRLPDADIRIDDPGFSERHAMIERAGGAIRLTDLGSADGSQVNGEQVRDAVLLAGDQLVFDAHHRFVVEAPARALLLPGAGDVPDETALDVGRQRATAGLPLPWLLLAALLLAALLSALLLFGQA